ncbi:hypothetical protein Ddc_04672 [Ditylenchus destructor]|nr:hypothetical protein Ddc_04672 [Ditylenchus destructor]
MTLQGECSGPAGFVRVSSPRESVLSYVPSYVCSLYQRDKVLKKTRHELSIKERSTEAKENMDPLPVVISMTILPLPAIDPLCAEHAGEWDAVAA